MTGFLDKLNLRPTERRLVVGVMIVVFIVLNLVFVRPHFKDWAVFNNEFKNAQLTLERFTTEIAKAPKYKQEQKQLESENSTLVPEEVAVQLRRIVQNQATQSGVIQNGLTDLPRNQVKGEHLFDESSIRMGFINTSDQDLVDFLYNLSAGKSMIRVKDLNVWPDGQMQKLQGDMTLTISYQKKIVPKTAVTAPATPAATKAAPTKPAITKPGATNPTAAAR